MIANNVHYRPQKPPEVGSEMAEYDACYFEITIDDSILGYN